MNTGGLNLLNSRMYLAHYSRQTARATQLTLVTGKHVAENGASNTFYGTSPLTTALS